jgi:hypothetical protein
MSDMVMHAEEAAGRKTAGLSYEDIVNALKEICAHRRGHIPNSN